MLTGPMEEDREKELTAKVITHTYETRSDIGV